MSGSAPRRCPECGLELAPSEMVCPDCGHRLRPSFTPSTPLPAPQAPPISYVCYNCGAAVSATYQYCPHCRIRFEPGPLALLHRQRGGCLTFFLLLYLVSEILAIPAIVCAGPTVHAILSGEPDWFITYLFASSILDSIAILALWNWRRWGLYLIVGSGVLSLILDQLAGFSLLYDLVGAIVLFILILLVSDIWNQMD